MASRALRRTSSVRMYATSTETPIHRNVVVVGGGVAGLTMAAALRCNPNTAHLTVSLIERNSLNLPDDWKTRPLTNRFVSLTPTSVTSLHDIGAWQLIARERTQDYYRMKVSIRSSQWNTFDQLKIVDGESRAKLYFDSVEAYSLGQRFGFAMSDSPTPIATLCELINLQAALMQRISEVGGVEIFQTQISSIYNTAGDLTVTDTNSRGYPVIKLDTGQELMADLLIGADGVNSRVREYAKIESSGWDYDQQGIIATLNTEVSFGEPTAWQSMSSAGIVALLPLPSNQASFVWSTKPEVAQNIKKLNGSAIAHLINAVYRLDSLDVDYLCNLSSSEEIVDQVNWRLSVSQYDDQNLPPYVESVEEGSVAAFPLKMRHADTYYGHRVALIGDAAHTIHPMSGQGLNQGIGDVQVLLSTLNEAILYGQDIGMIESLSTYAKDRYLSNLIMLGMTDKLNKLYIHGTNFPLVKFRSWAWNVLDRLDWAKSALIMGANSRMGF